MRLNKWLIVSALVVGASARDAANKALNAMTEMAKKAKDAINK